MGYLQIIETIAPKQEHVKVLNLIFNQSFKIPLLLMDGNEKQTLFRTKQTNRIKNMVHAHIWSTFHMKCMQF